MNAAELASAAAAEWRSAGPERKAAIIDVLFEQAWGDLSKHLNPKVVTYPIERWTLPHGIQITQTFDPDDLTAPSDGEYRWLREATFADLRAAVNIIYVDVVREAEYLKALGVLFASKTLDGAKDEDMLFDPAPASAAEARS